MPTTFCTILFGRNALTIKGDISSIVATDNQPGTTLDYQPFVDLNDLRSEVAQNKYITYEPNFWLLDGTYKFLPAVPQVGFMAASLSDGTGQLVGGGINLQFYFNSIHSSDGLTLHFSKLTGDYTSEVAVYWYDSVGNEIFSNTYYPNSTEYTISQTVSNFKSIVFNFWVTNKPYRFVRLTGIDFDDLIRFSGNEIKEAHLVEQIDPLSVELPIGELEFTLFSSDGNFSIIEPQGVYADLQQKEPIEVYEQVDDDLFFIGRFYLDTWESKSENIATFKAYDAIGLLDKTPYLGFLGGVDGYLVSTFIAEVFAAAGLNYELDTLWTTYGCDQHVPPGTAREALQQLLFQIYTVSPTRTAVAIAARSRDIRIPAFQLASALTEFDYVITSADQAKSELTLKPLVTDVKVIGHARMTEASTITIFNGSLATGNHTIVFETAMDNLSITGATITTTRANYVIINVASTGNVTLTGKRWVFPTTNITVHNSTAPSSALPNVITADGSLVTYPAATMTQRANSMIGYFNQRYLLKTTLFAPHAAVGDSVLIDVQSGRQLAGIVERMQIDLAGGFVAKTEITGVIVPL
jgi:hypothetical protein